MASSCPCQELALEFPPDAEHFFTYSDSNEILTNLIHMSVFEVHSTRVISSFSGIIIRKAGLNGGNFSPLSF